jgi:hypothetical protein
MRTTWAGHYCSVHGHVNATVLPQTKTDGDLQVVTCARSVIAAMARAHGPSLTPPAAKITCPAAALLVDTNYCSRHTPIYQHGLWSANMEVPTTRATTENFTASD